MRSVDRFDYGDLCRDYWNRLHNTYLFLERFVGSLSTIFLVTSTIESEFLVAKYKKKNPMILSDASLEVILNMKQYQIMRGLGV